MYVLVGLAPPSLLGRGSRHCYGIISQVTGTTFLRGLLLARLVGGKGVGRNLEIGTRGKLAWYAQAPNHTDSAGRSVSRRGLAGPRRRSRWLGQIGTKGLSSRVCAGLRRDAGLARRRSRYSNHPA